MINNLRDLGSFSKYLLTYATSIICFSLSLFTFSLLTLVLNQNISGIQFYLAIITTLVITVLLAKRLELKSHIFVGVGIFVLVLCSILGSIFVSRQFYDLSADGQGYHGEAMIQISRGWNYIYSSNDVPQYLERTTAWSKSYPKIAWTNSVAIYQLTGNYEDGKAFNILLILASLAIAWVAIKSLGLHSLPTSVLALIAGLNPISIVQLTSYNLDGQTSSYFVILFSIFILMAKFNSRLVIYGLLPAVVILNSNTKSAGLIYTIIFLFGFGVFKILLDRNQIILSAKGVILSVFLATCVFGFNPYVTNTFNFGHPLHPLLGNRRFQAFDENVPSNYLDKNNVEIFLSSLFFKSDAFFGGYNNPKDIAELKLPFTYTSEELTAMNGANTKKGGFGPLFSGALIVAIIALIASSYLAYSEHKEQKAKEQNEEDTSEDLNFEEEEESIYETNFGRLKIVLYCIILFFAASIISNTSNNARYVPYVWQFLTLVLLFGFSLRNKIVQALCYICAIVIFINIGLIANTNLKYQYSTTQETKAKLQEISEQTQDKPVKVNFGYMTATRLRLEDNNIQYEAIPREEPLNCAETGRYSFLPSNETNACTDYIN